MQSVITFLKRFPWWTYVLAIVAVFFLWQYVSGYVVTNKLWNIVKEEITSDEKRIIEELEKDNLRNQKEKESLYKELNRIKQQRDQLSNEKLGLKAENERLRHAMENVNTPSDPDELVILLRKLGLKSATRESK